ncbi:MAG: hypothetical protein ACK5XZ_00650 [Hyphomonadaceae bacterium]|jgi:hypothetical protein|uniref:hypothetical protein n=1 Tax=Aquidulcibacter sp. TaxID=2052990 RepID=UPI0022CC0B43|nr:hypothetical protein [Aquidulcibacter sp.]MCZ8207695.1 hypothetical protein [Aquidulcibacter sp.]
MKVATRIGIISLAMFPVSGCYTGDTHIEIQGAAMLANPRGQTMGYLTVDAVDAKRIAWGPNQIRLRTCTEGQNISPCFEYKVSSVVSPMAPFAQSNRFYFGYDPNGEINITTGRQETDFDVRKIKCIKIRVLPGDFKPAGESDWFCNLRFEAVKDAATDTR